MRLNPNPALSSRALLRAAALIGLGFAACRASGPSRTADPFARSSAEPYIVVLGTAQDAGYPQAACERSCCRAVHEGRRAPVPVTCLGLVDPARGGLYLFECTPDFPAQWRRLQEELGAPTDRATPNGIFLTHAHVGHYTGLTHLGRESIGARGTPVFAMPRMASFLATSGPWSQLVELRNIELVPLTEGRAQPVGSGSLTVTPLVVPHRDELSETVGFVVRGPRRSALFLPDIDKWSRWDRDLRALLAEVDVAYLDATFFADGEIEGRDMASIPHPFVEETVALLADLPAAERAKVRFIHLNHTNPLLWDERARAEVEEAGHRVARVGERVGL